MGLPKPCVFGCGCICSLPYTLSRVCGSVRVRVLSRALLRMCLPLDRLRLDRGLRLAAEQLKKAHGFDFHATDLKDINRLIMKEYLDEFNGKVPA